MNKKISITAEEHRDIWKALGIIEEHLESERVSEHLERTEEIISKYLTV
jgi:hypothetical protein